ncbi:MAG: glycosyltransferase family 39 protein [Candidatus Woesebacteria bacterium]
MLKQKLFKFKPNKFIANYFFFCLFFFTFFASGMVDSQDGFQYLAITRRMYYDHTFELPVKKPPHNVHMNIFPGKDGKIYSPTGLGYSLAFLPAVMFEDLFLKLSGREPLATFPLESDWPVLLVASMTNAFFGAILVVTLYQYLKSFNINHKRSLLLSFIAMVSTNLFVYTKHVYPHMMFVSFLTLAFYLLRQYSLKKQKKHLFFSGLAYGVVIITYNPTFVLPALPFALYYLLLTKVKFNLKKIKSNIKILKQIIIDAFYGFLGILPFWLIYSCFNTVRFGNATSAGYGSSAGTKLPLIPPPYVIIEGIWGVLFSPGRSIFIYTPLLLMLFLFWWKLKKRLIPEIISFSLLSLIYVLMIGINRGAEDFLAWHGEVSWGNRYMIVIIPFLFILIANIYQTLSKYNKYFAFLPLVLIGLYVQSLGILFPYQIKRGALPNDIYINEDSLNFGEYPNFIPRYSAVFKMSKVLFKRLKNIKNIYDHGDYNLKLYDGYDSPFDLGWTKWRGTMPTAHISFDNNKKDKIHDLTLQFRNHQLIPSSTYSAQISFNLNDQNLDQSTIIIPADKDQEAKLQFSTDILKDQNNILKVDTNYIGTSSAQLKKKQTIFLQIIRINGLAQNINTLDYPYVSPISESLYGTEYHYWGNEEQNLWEIWNVHSRVFEETFDLWWLRPLHYWDFPKDVFSVLFTLNIIGIVFFGNKIWIHILFKAKTE